MTLQPLLSSLTSEFEIGYIDDTTLGGTFSAVSQDVEKIGIGGEVFGLHLTIQKCELISSESFAHNPVQYDALSNFIAVRLSDSCLLAVPLFSRSVFKTKIRQFKSSF